MTYGLEITDAQDGYVDRYKFDDPEWAEWLVSLKPRIRKGESRVAVRTRDVPASLARAISDNREEWERDEEDEDGVKGIIGDLTIGSYLDDKVLFVARGCESATPEEIASCDDVWRSMWY